MSATVFLCGDVMPGRGIDQIYPHPCAPELREEYLTSAVDYVHLAERAHGPIPRHVEPGYVWGDSLDDFARVKPQARIINLETSITCADTFAHKGINYRMSPRNAGLLKAAAIDCCVLANNHILDFGIAGLDDTLATLARLDIQPAGAGRELAQARAPAIVDIGEDRRAVVIACATITSGTPEDWAAGAAAPGVNLSSLSPADVQAMIADAVRVKGQGDIAIASVHWGPNWGYEIEAKERRFAHHLIDGGFSIVHGHSSHHPKAIEIYHNRLILYGCGDFLNDYEGITGHEAYRHDLSLMYFATMNDAGDLQSLELVPMQMRRFRLGHASPEDARWLQHRLDRESRQFGTHVVLGPDGRMFCRR